MSEATPPDPPPAERPARSATNPDALDDCIEAAASVGVAAWALGMAVVSRAEHVETALLDAVNHFLAPTDQTKGYTPTFGLSGPIYFLRLMRQRWVWDVFTREYCPPRTPYGRM